MNKQEWKEYFQLEERVVAHEQALVEVAEKLKEQGITLESIPLKEEKKKAKKKAKEEKGEEEFEESEEGAEEEIDENY